MEKKAIKDRPIPQKRKFSNGLTKRETLEEHKGVNVRNRQIGKTKVVAVKGAAR